MKKSSSEMLINPRVVFTFTRLGWRSTTTKYLHILREYHIQLLTDLASMNIKYIFTLQYYSLLLPDFRTSNIFFKSYVFEVSGRGSDSVKRQCAENPQILSFYQIYYHSLLTHNTFPRTCMGYILCAKQDCFILGTYMRMCGARSCKTSYFDTGLSKP